MNQQTLQYIPQGQEALYAAAPQLLEAVKAMAKFVINREQADLDDDGTPRQLFTTELNICREAISHAEGGTQ